MKKLLFIFLFLAGVACCHGQDREAVIKVLSEQQNAWNKGDIEGFMQGYWKSDSLLFVTSSEPLHGWQAMLERYKRTYPGKAGMGELKFTIIKVDMLDGHNAFVLGGWGLKLESGKTPGGYFTLWFRKIDGEWKIVCDHTS